MDATRLSVIAGQLGNLSAQLERLSEGRLRRELQDQISQLIDQLRQEERQRQLEAQRLDEILDVLFGLAGSDFSKRASVGQEGNILDAVAAAANLLSEEVEAAQSALAERNRALETATASKNQFMANMSHEIRTPLSALMGFAELLLDLRLQESDRLNYAMIIRRNGEHLLSLINDILDLSKIEAGKLRLELLECSLSRILTDVETLMKARALEAGLAFEIEFMTPVPERFYSDPTRLRQILLNLVGNAVKFTNQGSIRLVLSYYGDPPMLSFTIVDTGIGMDEAQQARLFKPFEQADASMTRRFGGTGLGLAICQPLAEALGGELQVRSRPGEGSTFTLRIAVELPDNEVWIDQLERTANRENLIVGHQAPRLTGAILLAEDGPDNQLYISTILQRSGLYVDVADNGERACEQALAAWQAGRPYDVILMDMQMPVLDGYSATLRLRKAGYPGRIIALTAHAMIGEREKCLALGCDDFLTKPIDRPRLLQAISGNLEPSSASPQSAEAEEGPLYSSFSEDPDMEELLEKFVGSMPAKLAELHQASQDRGELERLAHQLKGSAGGYGFWAISFAAGELEDVLRNQGDFDRQYATLQNLCRRVRLKAGRG